MRVLLVEDDPDCAEILALVLESEGYLVHIVDNAISALRYVKRCRPEVVLVDIGLPVIDGFELAKRIRSLGHCSLIAISSRPPPADGSHTDHFERYLTKPIDVAMLREALNAVAARS